MYIVQKLLYMWFSDSVMVSDCSLEGAVVICVCLLSTQKYKKPKFIQCFVFSLTGDVLTGDSEGSILTWCKLAADVKTLGKGAKGKHPFRPQSLLSNRA